MQWRFYMQQGTTAGTESFCDACVGKPLCYHTKDMLPEQWFTVQDKDFVKNRITNSFY